MQFEDVLDRVGGFGLYQKLMALVLIPCSTALVGLTYYVQLIVLSRPPYKCSAFEYEDVFSTFNSTLMSNSTPYEVCPDSYSQMNATGYESTCTGFEYDNDALFSTLASEEGWVCSESWRTYAIVTAFWIGNLVGAWGLGLASDIYGRRPVILICFMVYGVVGVASAFVRNFYLFLILRTLVGTVHHTFTHLPYILVIEYCSKNRRTVPLFTTMVSYTIGSMMAPALAYLIWDWQILLIVTMAPNLLIFFLYKLVPESASWQLTQGRVEDAARSLHTVARLNKTGLAYDDILSLLKQPEDTIMGQDDGKYQTKLEDAGKKEEEKETMLSALKYPTLRKQIIICMFVWMSGCMCYYGHSQNTSNLDPWLLRSFFLGSLVEIPAWLVPIIIEKFGRRIPLVNFFAVSGTAGVAYCAISLLGLGGPVMKISLGLFGRLAVTAAYFTALQYVPEIFPTVVRGQGVAMAETMGGIAIFLSPVIVYLNEITEGLPLLVFGVIGMLTAVLTLGLPETKGVTLPDTLKEAEEAAQNKKSENQNKSMC